MVSLFHSFVLNCVAEHGRSVVYEYPSVKKLADYILALQSGQSAEKSDEQQREAMLAMLEKYSAQFVTRTTATTSPQDDSHIVVSIVDFPSSGWSLKLNILLDSQVLTGATGSLGAHILALLSAQTSVKKIICLSRASSHDDSLKRVKDSLKSRKLTVDESKLVSYAANTNAELLGLSKEEYGSIRDEATIVIHVRLFLCFVLYILRHI